MRLCESHDADEDATDADDADDAADAVLTTHIGAHSRSIYVLTPFLDAIASQSTSSVSESLIGWELAIEFLLSLFSRTPELQSKVGLFSSTALGKFCYIYVA